MSYKVVSFTLLAQHAQFMTRQSWLYCISALLKLHRGEMKTSSVHVHKAATQPDIYLDLPH